MNRAMRWATFSVVLVLLAVAGWRIVGQRQAERTAGEDPSRALEWRPYDPEALLVLAERQLTQGDPAAAQQTARRLLAHEPMQGAAFRVLAEVADRGGDRPRAFTLYRIAERRAPRDLATRAWLAQRYLEQGDYPQALVQVDRVLRLAPQRASGIHPVLVQLATDPAFATALATTLRQSPPWREGLLAALRDPKTGDPLAAGQVMQALQDQGGLNPRDYARWLDSLIAQGRWGEAYARWAGGVDKPGGRLPLVYNGDFASIPSDAGFDWRRRHVPGVLLAFEQVAGAQGSAAYLRLLNRRIPNVGLEQPLLLSPGRYQLRLRMRAHALRSAVGLQWQVACAGPAGVIARSEPVDGSFGWRPHAIAFSVPGQGCPGQWLRLVNPVAAGAAQQVGGELWLDDMAIEPAAAP